MSVPNTLPDVIRDFHDRLADIERRVQNKKRTGTIHEVNAAEGWARVKFGEDADGKPYLSPKIPWQEVAMGAIKTHFPPEVGEQVEVISESGDLTDSYIQTSIPSNANPRPHDKAREGVITVGNMRMHIKDGLCDIMVGSKRVKISSDRVDINPG